MTKSHRCTTVVQTLLVASSYVQAAEPPFAQNAKAMSEGLVGAGEGPAWD
jgi:hypothetical protein